MDRSHLVTLAAGAAFGLGLALAAFPLSPRPIDAQSAGSTDHAAAMGAGDAGAVDEPFGWETVKGNRQRANFQRSVLKVPESYGDLVTITGAGATSVLWYRDKEGALRNVTVGSAKLVKVERQAAK
jgi:hypothetical protein